MYIINPKISIPDGANVILPLSLGQPLHTGEALRALLHYYRRYQPTLLLADTLHRFNTDHATSLAEGDKFIQAHEIILSDFILIRWDEWLEHYRLQIQPYKLLLQTEYDRGQLFYEKCQQTASLCLSNSSIEKSIQYQIEEYAATLAMAGEFNYLVYPRPASPGASALYHLFASIPKPTYVNANTIKSNTRNKHKDHKPSPLAARLICDQIETLFASSEISKETKLALYEKIVDLAAVYL